MRAGERAAENHKSPNRNALCVAFRNCEKFQLKHAKDVNHKQALHEYRRSLGSYFTSFLPLGMQAGDSWSLSRVADSSVKVDRACLP
jgi:hypothetical protein